MTIQNSRTQLLDPLETTTDAATAKKNALSSLKAQHFLRNHSTQGPNALSESYDQDNGKTLQALLDSPIYSFISKRFPRDTEILGKASQLYRLDPHGFAQIAKRENIGTPAPVTDVALNRNLQTIRAELANPLNFYGVPSEKLDSLPENKRYALSQKNVISVLYNVWRTNPAAVNQHFDKLAAFYDESPAKLAAVTTHDAQELLKIRNTQLSDLGILYDLDSNGKSLRDISSIAVRNLLEYRLPDIAEDNRTALQKLVKLYQKNPAEFTKFARKGDHHREDAPIHFHEIEREIPARIPENTVTSVTENIRAIAGKERGR